MAQPMTIRDAWGRLNLAVVRDSSLHLFRRTLLALCVLHRSVLTSSPVPSVTSSIVPLSFV